MIPSYILSIFKHIQKIFEDQDYYISDLIEDNNEGWVIHNYKSNNTSLEFMIIYSPSLPTKLLFHKRLIIDQGVKHLSHNRYLLADPDLIDFISKEIHQ